jgi:hypothetical protein
LLSVSVIRFGSGYWLLAIGYWLFAKRLSAACSSAARRLTAAFPMVNGLKFDIALTRQRVVCLKGHRSLISRHDRKVGFLVFPEFQILDLTGPLAAFEMPGRRVTPKPYQLHVLSESGGP